MNRLGWELHQKHIFILSASGKPIFSYYGDEQEMVTTFGLLQAVISIVLDSGDSIRYIKAGNRKIVFMVESSLYFVCISSTNEPEIVLLKQLQFLYSQILLVLTAKVHDVLRINPSTDLRHLLGADTTRLMKANPIAADASDVTYITPPYVTFESVKHFACKSDLRKEIFSSLKFCVENSGAASGLFLYKDALIAFSPNSDMELPMSTADLVLVTHFVANSASLRSSDQHWIPICLPDFNDKGFLQAYVSSLQVTSQKASDSGFLLVLIAASADPDVFRKLHKNRLFFEKTISDPVIADGLQQSSAIQQNLVDKFLEPSNSIHFLYKRRSCGGGGIASNGSASHSGLLNRRNSSIMQNANSAFIPAQYLASSMDGLPFEQSCSQNK